MVFHRLLPPPSRPQLLSVSRNVASHYFCAGDINVHFYEVENKTKSSEPIMNYKTYYLQPNALRSHPVLLAISKEIIQYTGAGSGKTKAEPRYPY